MGLLHHPFLASACLGILVHHLSTFLKEEARLDRTLCPVKDEKNFS